MPHSPKCLWEGKQTAVYISRLCWFSQIKCSSNFLNVFKFSFPWKGNWLICLNMSPYHMLQDCLSWFAVVCREMKDFVGEHLPFFVKVVEKGSYSEQAQICNGWNHVGACIQGGMHRQKLWLPKGVETVVAQPTKPSKELKSAHSFCRKYRTERNKSEPFTL